MLEALSELHETRLFTFGDRIRAVNDVRNDGTLSGFARGDIIIRKGDIGYIRDVGTYLNRFTVYAVDFLALGRIVGMRSHEIAADDESGTVANPVAESPVLESAVTKGEAETS